MSDTIFTSSRTFRVWLYTVSHSILLLRSVKASGLATRVDIIFKPVRYMSVPQIFDGIDIRLVDPATLTGELAAVFGAYGAKDKIFALSGVKGGAWVVSGTVASHEDEGSDSDPSHFDVPRIQWQ
jgi:hypothetical protein